MASFRSMTRFHAFSAATIALSLLALVHAACATSPRSPANAGVSASGPAASPAAALALAATASATPTPGASTATVPAVLLTVHPPMITASVAVASASVHVPSPNPTAVVAFGTNPPAPPRTLTLSPSPAPPLPCEGDYIPYQPPTTPFPTPPPIAGRPTVTIANATPIPEPAAQPTLYGPFRLFPSGYRQPLHSQRLHCPSPPPLPPFVNSADPAVVRQSPLFKEPAAVPAGYRLTEMRRRAAANVEGSVELYYEGPGDPISIEITQLVVLPVDYEYPFEGSQYPFVFQQAQVAGVPAIIDHQAYPVDDDVHVEFVIREVIYILKGRARTLQEVPALIQQLTQMAESLR